MNEYQKKQREKVEKFCLNLQPIINELGGTWRLREMDPDAWPSRSVIADQETGFNLWFQIGLNERLQVSAGNWPTFTRVDGSVSNTYPGSLRPEEKSPHTSANLKRSPRLIAGQIARRVIGPAIKMEARLQEYCDANQKRNDDNLAALERLIEAAGANIRKRDEHCIFYASNIPGSARIEFHAGSVELHLTAEQALKCIEVLKQ